MHDAYAYISLRPRDGCRSVPFGPGPGALCACAEGEARRGPGRLEGVRRLPQDELARDRAAVDRLEARAQGRGVLRLPRRRAGFMKKWWSSPKDYNR